MTEAVAKIIADAITEAVGGAFVSDVETNRAGENANLIDAIYALAASIRSAAREVGKEGAAGMGALEAVAFQIKEGCEQLALAIGGLRE